MRNANGTFKKGHTPSNATRIKMGISRTGTKNYLYGKHLSVETKQKLRISNLGQHRSIETKQKLRDIQKINGNGFKVFLNQMQPINRRLYLEEFGKKISLYKHEYRKAHPIWSPPDWQSYKTYLSVPQFVPIINQRLTPPQQISYYCSGLMPRGML